MKYKGLIGTGLLLGSLAAFIYGSAGMEQTARRCREYHNQLSSNQRGMITRAGELENILKHDLRKKDIAWLRENSGYFSKAAADVLSQLPGVEKEKQEGHDIAIKYKGRTKKLTGGSSGTGQTDAQAVDQILDMIIEQDIKQGHLHKNNKDKRRDALKKSIYRE